jgi:threonine dehydratase
MAEAASRDSGPASPGGAEVPWDLPSLRELEAAARLVYRVLPPTPQYRWPLLDARVGAEVWVKHENHTPVGSFKVRGGVVYMERLQRLSPDVEGVVAATRGNHGQSVAFAAARRGLSVAIVVPHGNSVEKNASMRALGAELLERGADFQESLEAAEGVAAERGWHLMPSFDPHLVRGVGTYALELFRHTEALDTVYVPIGMGSGACGVLAARDALGLSTRVVGVVSASAPAYALSIEAGRPISHPVSTRIADGMACRTPDPRALDLLGAGLERVVRVADREVEAAMRALYRDTHNVAEGAGAAALAALLQDGEGTRGRKVAIVLSGGNVDSHVLARVLAERG